MGSRIDNSAIALTANDSTRLLHLRYDIHLAHCSSVVFAAIFAGHITQGTG